MKYELFTPAWKSENDIRDDRDTFAVRFWKES